MDGQDWKVVTFSKSTPKSKNPPSSKNPPGSKNVKYVNKTFGKELQQARLAKGINQKILAKTLNLDSSELKSWEIGSKIPPNNEVISNLSKYLGVKLPRNEKMVLSEESN